MDTEEELSMEKELRWLLEEQVKKDLAEIQNTLMECSRRFPYRMGFDGNKTVNSLLNNKILDWSKLKGFADDNLNGKKAFENFVRKGENAYDRTVAKPQRNLLSNPNNTGQIKCVVTLLGDSVCDADISFKHKSGKENHIFKTKLAHDIQWKLQQVQDAANHLAKTLSVVNSYDPDHVFKTAKEVELILDEVMKLLTLGRTCLAFPKRKSIDELIRASNMQNFQPPVPNDVAVSFYIHSNKLILAIYHLQHVSSQQIDIISRHQVECSVQWLNEAVILFTLAIQQCQQLKDKVKAVQRSREQKVS